MSDQDTTEINRYLLGQLPREEADRIEARLLSEAGLFELAESVEDEVIDRYVRGELAPEERRRFERRLLSSERIGERVAFARALAAHGSRRDALPVPVERAATVVPLFRPAAARLAWAATFVVALLGGWLAFQVVQLDDRAEELEAARIAALQRAEEATVRAGEAESTAETARLRQSEAVNLERQLAEARAQFTELETEGLPADAVRGDRRVRRPGDYGEKAATVVLLLAPATRSAGAAVEVLRLDDDDERVELQVVLAGPRPAESITATVTRGGQVVWQDEGIEPLSLGGESIVTLSLQEESFRPGRYRVELMTAEPEPRPLGSYEFSVDR
jgi:hypothetical protein